MNPSNEAALRKAIIDYEAGNAGDNMQTIMRIFDEEGLAYCAHNMALFGSRRFARYRVVGRDAPIPCAEMDRRLSDRHAATKIPDDDAIYKVARQFDVFGDCKSVTPMLIGDDILKFTKAMLFLYGNGRVPDVLRNSSAGGERHTLPIEPLGSDEWQQHCVEIARKRGDHE